MRTKELVIEQRGVFVEEVGVSDIGALLRTCQHAGTHGGRGFNFSAYAVVLAILVVKTIGVESTGWNLGQEVARLLEQLPELGRGVDAAGEATAAPDNCDGFRHGFHVESAPVILGRVDHLRICVGTEGASRAEVSGD